MRQQRNNNKTIYKYMQHHSNWFVAYSIRRFLQPSSTTFLKRGSRFLAMKFMMEAIYNDKSGIEVGHVLGCTITIYNLNV